MRAFSLEDLKQTPINTVRVRAPEFDKGKDDQCFCYVRVMTQDEKDTRVDDWWQKRKKAREQADDDSRGRQSWIAAASLCHEDGKWIAETSIAVGELCDQLDKQPATAVQRILLATGEANAIGAAEVEKIEKN